MKITKTRLKQIIIEELLKEEEREGTWHRGADGSKVFRPKRKTFVPEFSPVRRVSADEILKKHWLDLGLFIDWLVTERKLPEAIKWQRATSGWAPTRTLRPGAFRGIGSVEEAQIEKKIEEIITEFPIDIAPWKDCVEKLNLLKALPRAFMAAPTHAAIEKFNGRTLDWEGGPEESEPEESWMQRWTRNLRGSGLLPENNSGETPYQICKKTIEAYKQTQRDMGPFIARTSAEDSDIAEPPGAEAELRALGRANLYREVRRTYSPAPPPAHTLAGISEGQLKQIIAEELTKTDKADIKKMISKELKDILEDELVKALKTSDIKSDIGEVAKKVIKKLYKDLSFHHPYIIDRIKV